VAPVTNPSHSLRQPLAGRGHHGLDLRPGAPWDADAARTAALLGAYFQFEESRALRRRVCRTAAAIALLAIVVEGSSRLVDAASFFTILIALATTICGAAVLEWRAEKNLVALMPDR
jgi:hypothetical protein